MITVERYESRVVVSFGVRSLSTKTRIVDNLMKIARSAVIGNRSGTVLIDYRHVLTNESVIKMDTNKHARAFVSV